MKTAKIVKVRFKRFFEKQKSWFFIGKVMEFSQDWITIHGKAIVFDTGQVDPVDVDGEAKTIMIPRENVSHIRVLPDDFDITTLDVYLKKGRWFLKVKGQPDASLAEK